jgi:hypothetical protein
MEAAAIMARRLREAQLVQRLEWRQMAVLARTGDQVELLRAALAAAGIPVHVPGAEVLVVGQPAVAALLAAAEWAVGRRPMTPAMAAWLLCSPLGGFDPATLRAVRRALAMAGPQTSPADQLLAELLNGRCSEGGLSGIEQPWAEHLGRLRQALAAGKAAAVKHGGAADVLWAVWDAAGWAPVWRREALAGGARGQQADQALDAILALFAAAERHDARHPGSGAGGFLAEIDSQEVPGDTVAPHAPTGDRVTCSTVASAAGHEWELVAIAGLEEDTWPDLRLRDTLLGAGQLADLLDGTGGDVSWPERRRRILEDETRLLLLAVTRAKAEVLAVTVENLDAQPSRFVQLLAGEDWNEAPSAAWLQAMPFDLRGLVAGARASLGGQFGAVAPGESPAPGESEQAAEVLAVLALAGLPGADPTAWPGLLPPSSDESLFAGARRPVFSPSAIGALVECPLKWALSRHGGQTGSTEAATLGSLIHWLAETYPLAGTAELMEHLAEEWPKLELPANYSHSRLRAKAEQAVNALGGYQQANADRYAASEVEISSPRPGGSAAADALPAGLRGRIDRLEKASRPDGSQAFQVVDFKTSASAITAKQAESDPQLGAYQLALEAGLVDGFEGSAGAELVYLASNTKRPSTRQQAPLRASANPEWMVEVLEGCVAASAQPSFRAQVGKQCLTCSVKTACPAVAEGKQVTV